MTFSPPFLQMHNFTKSLMHTASQVVDGDSDPQSTPRPVERLVTLHFLDLVRTILEYCLLADNIQENQGTTINKYISGTEFGWFTVRIYVREVVRATAAALEWFFHWEHGEKPRWLPFAPTQLPPQVIYIALRAVLRTHPTEPITDADRRVRDRSRRRILAKMSPGGYGVNLQRNAKGHLRQV
jgi:hypothetical protein